MSMLQEDYQACLALLGHRRQNGVSLQAMFCKGARTFQED